MPRADLARIRAVRLRSVFARSALISVAALSLVVARAAAAGAQVIVSPNAEPTRNDGGWVYWIAVALAVVTAIIVLGVVTAYLRYAPRFQREEGGPRTVRAPRLQPGREAPRRPVNVTGAPVVVPPPAVAVAATPAPAAPVPAAPTPAPAAAAAAPAPAPAPPAEAPAPAAAETPAAPAAPGPAPAGSEHKEVALDQETFDRVLAELLEKGTNRRVAEGQARRAAMIAARKKAGG